MLTSPGYRKKQGLACTGTITIDACSCHTSPFSCRTSTFSCRLSACHAVSCCLSACRNSSAACCRRTNACFCLSETGTLSTSSHHELSTDNKQVRTSFGTGGSRFSRQWPVVSSSITAATNTPALPTSTSQIHCGLTATANIATDNFQDNAVVAASHNGSGHSAQIADIARFDARLSPTDNEMAALIRRTRKRA